MTTGYTTAVMKTREAIKAIADDLGFIGYDNGTLTIHLDDKRFRNAFNEVSTWYPGDDDESATHVELEHEDGEYTDWTEGDDVSVDALAEQFTADVSDGCNLVVSYRDGYSDKSDALILAVQLSKALGFIDIVFTA